MVPGRLLLDVARSLPKDSVSLEYRSSQQDVEVISGSAKFHLRTLPLEDFPKLPEADPCQRARRAGRRVRRDDRAGGPLAPRGTRRART